MAKTPSLFFHHLLILDPFFEPQFSLAIKTDFSPFYKAHYTGL